MKSIGFSAKRAAGVAVVAAVAVATMASAMTTGPGALFADASALAQEALIKDGGNRAGGELKQRFGALASSGSYGSTRSFESLVSAEALDKAASNNLKEAEPTVGDPPLGETPPEVPTVDENGNPIGGGGGFSMAGGGGGGGGAGGGGRGLGLGGLLGLAGVAGIVAGVAASDDTNAPPAQCMSPPCL